MSNLIEVRFDDAFRFAGRTRREENAHRRFARRSIERSRHVDVGVNSRLQHALQCGDRLASRRGATFIAIGYYQSLDEIELIGHLLCDMQVCLATEDGCRSGRLNAVTHFDCNLYTVTSEPIDIDVPLV